MYRRFVRATTAFENSHVLTAVRRGLMAVIPVLMAGSFSLLITSLPVPAFRQWLEQAAGGGILTFLNLLYNATFGFISGYLTVSISYYYAAALGGKSRALRVTAAVTSMACFAASFGAVTGQTQLGDFGPTGIFTALVCALVSTRLFIMLCGLFTRRRGRYSAGEDANLSDAMSGIFPLGLCVSLFILFNLLIHALFGADNFNDLVANTAVAMFKQVGGGYSGGALFVFLLQFLWFFGMHGGNVLEDVSLQLFVPANTNPDLIVSKSFIDTFANIGGCGATLCLVLGMIFFCKTRQKRRLGLSSLPFALFNINEPLLFGFPLVLNPVMLIPMILVPLCSFTTAYLFTLWGVLPVVTETVAWTTPVLLSGYAATHSAWGVGVQLFNLILGTAVYLPFFRLSERLLQLKNISLMDTLEQTYKDSERRGVFEPLLERQDHLGIAARQAAIRLREDLRKDAIAVYYQLQWNDKNEITGAEALLRWKYAEKPVYPPLAVALAQEDQHYEELTGYILRTTCRDLRALCEKFGTAFQVSVNITAAQLNDGAFISRVIQMAGEAGITRNLGLEVTEETSLTHYEQVSQNIERLHASDISIAIDDFSMGQTSLKYLQHSSFHFVKLDGDLVKRIVHCDRCKEIISSIILLGRQLDFQTIAEYVESPEIRDCLVSLGCRYFQGYLLGRAEPLDVLIASPLPVGFSVKK